ncbi:DUF664 domain-containing protein [Kocuria flava]|uniref:mycothiol transferase n=1 Tax=Kocuria flava TaxID=446860 RepID=UPI003F1C89BD
MPFLTPNVTDERDALATFAAQQVRQVAAALHGLDPAQLRAVPSASAVSLGALARHVLAVCEDGLLEGLAPPEGSTGSAPSAEDRYAAGALLPEAVRPGDTAESLTEALYALAERIETVLRTADPEARVPVPDAPWFPEDLESWPLRWVALHLVEECARHAGHADIIRESLDGRTAYELNALADGARRPPRG